MKQGLFTKKKILCFAGLAFLALLLFVCCEGIPGDQTTKEESEGEQTEKARVSDYILVRGDTSGNEVLRQVLELKSAIDERFDTNTRSSTDWAVDAEGANGRVREILVGETNREESVAINAELAGVNGYIIRSVGDKIVITASTTGLLTQAVDRFTKDYIEESKDGTLPQNIDIIHTTALPLGVMSDESCMKVYLSSRATGALRHAVNDFADRISELSGLRPVIEFTADMATDEVRFSFKDEVFSKDEAHQSHGPEAAGGGMWTLLCEGKTVRLQGEDELRLMAGLAGFYEILESGADRTLDGKTVFFYEGVSVRRESWQSALPRLIGGGYMGSESVAGNCIAWYYENVSLNDLCAWKLLILEEALGSCQTVTNTGDYAEYVNYAENIEITVFYNSETRSVSINERSLS